jgi:hypothetical protein
MKAIVGERYRHYKGNEYTVLATALHSETLEEMVIYEAQHESDYGKRAVWARPREMFEERIKIDGNIIDRFSKVA